MSSYWYMCVLILAYHAGIYVCYKNSYGMYVCYKTQNVCSYWYIWYICVPKPKGLLYMCPYATLYATIYVCSYYCICVLILVYMCPEAEGPAICVSLCYFICVLILLYLCPHATRSPTIYVSSCYELRRPNTDVV